MSTTLSNDTLCTGACDEGFVCLLGECIRAESSVKVIKSRFVRRRPDKFTYARKTRQHGAKSSVDLNVEEVQSVVGDVVAGDVRRVSVSSPR
ncbi:hypothetical protein HDU77_005182 [Chytriomyces hyalinus]|nr:hypothetical protein HDU77_005182 [Chytriomyces hyalinus]